MEGVVLDGWLVKSPPEKRIFKAKWRQRWFVLRHSGHLPGQFVLEYFTDNSCKKLKGRIDLDQCEQVDAGLTFESKKTSYQFMFDIRTPKRIYYLVAETELEMNKWVECICSVCGLKIHIDEDFLVPQENTQNANSAQSSATNLTEVKSTSNPYIPISECHTGKPVLNGKLPSSESFHDLPKDSPPPPLSAPPPNAPPPLLSTPQPPLVAASPPLSAPPPPLTAPPPLLKDWNLLDHSLLTDEFYDHPKPINRSSLDLQSNIDTENTRNVPSHFRSESEPIPLNDVFSTLPSSKANWNISLDDDVPINSSTVPRMKLNSKNEQPEYDVVPPFHGSIRDVKSQRSVQNLASVFEKVTVTSLTATETSPKILLDSNSGYVNDVSIPPRPPKPSKLRDKPSYENFRLPHQAQKEEDKNAYDVPPPPTKQTSLPVFSYVKNESGDDLSPSTKVPLSSSAGVEGTMDDVYDFPKFRSEDNINATVPVAQNTGTTGRPRRHAYTNAPPGLFNSKDLIFNYEYRPSLMTSDGYLSSDAVKSIHSSSDAASPPSPSAIGAYANVPTSPTLSASFQTDVPPAVNRELKPKRVLSNEERGPFTLQPPPVCRSRTKANKRSFRKPRAAPSPTPSPNLNGMPPVPNRFRAHPEMSATSDDEMSNSSGSRRNSANDEQTRHLFPAASKKDEIQYLDLDLDSEPSPSPKSPERSSASTVYKKVDFVKTKAFNEMRQNVEESYRKSQ